MFLQRGDIVLIADSQAPPSASLAGPQSMRGPGTSDNVRMISEVPCNLIEISSVRWLKAFLPCVSVVRHLVLYPPLDHTSGACAVHMRCYASGASSPCTACCWGYRAGSPGFVRGGQPRAGAERAAGRARQPRHRQRVRGARAPRVGLRRPGPARHCMSRGHVPWCRRRLPDEDEEPACLTRAPSCEPWCI